MSAFKSIVPLSNRRLKRQFKQEAMKYGPELQQIIELFVFALWSYPEHIKYNDIFNHYNELWKERIDSFQKGKNDLLAIDKDFFFNNYKSKIKTK